MSNSTDDLVHRAVQGDKKALGSLLKQHGPAARGVIAGRIPARWQSVLSEDDVMQQTYADAVRGIASLSRLRDQSFVSWLRKTAKRNLLMAIRLLEAEKRGGLWRPQAVPASDASYVDLLDAISGTGKTPSSAAAAKEAKSALTAAISKLPGAYARVVTMYDLEGRALQEVSEALRRSPGAALMLRARAHDRLKESMQTASRWLSSG